MIKSLTVTNVLGASKKMGLYDSDSSGILITNIEGVGAEEATIYTTDYASIDGAFLNSTRIPSRDISITLKPLEDKDHSIEDRRLEMYKYFPIKQKVTLTFETDKRVAEIVGYVTKNTAEIFSEDERITIEVRCPDPYFYDVGNYNGITETIFTGITQEFEFPYENDISEYLPMRKTPKVNYIKDETEPEDHSVVTWRSMVRTDWTSQMGGKSDDYLPVSNDFFNNPEEKEGATITIVSHMRAGDTETYLTNNTSTNSYRIYNSDGTDFTQTQFEAMTDGDTSQDVMIVLKLMDGRLYIQSYIKPRRYDEPYNDASYFPKRNAFQKTIFGSRETKLERVIIYKGDVPIGFRFTVEVLANITNLKVYNVDTRKVVEFNDTKLATLAGGGLHNGDRIIFNTVKGNKYIILERDGQEISLLNYINPDAEWFQLNVGDNVFSYSCSDIEGVNFSIRNRTAFIGI